MMALLKFSRKRIHILETGTATVHGDGNFALS